MAERTRQCPRSLGTVYDADQEPTDPDERPAVDWDAWEKDRFTGWNRWWLLLMMAITVASAIGFLINGGDYGPFGSG